jgi:flagellar hook assembly protein FlgD
LNEAYPNPFNPSTNIDFSIYIESYVSIKVYNLQGKEIDSLIDQQYESGNHTVTWDASQYPSGIYFVKMVSDNFTDTKKLMLIK